MIDDDEDLGEVAEALSHQPLEGTTDRAAQAIHALLYPKEQAESPAQPAKPEPEDELGPLEGEPSAEVEGAVSSPEPVEPEPETPAPEPVAKKAAPEPEAKATEPDPQANTLTQLSQSILQLQAGIAAEFSDIKTQADLFKVGQEDPQRYNRFIIHSQQLNAAVAERDRLSNDVEARWYRTEADKLTKLLPEIADPAKGAALKAEIASYAAKRGYTPEVLKRASANDIVTLHKAMQYDAMQAADKAKPAKVEAKIAEAKEKAAKAPPVQKPGVAKEEDGSSRVKEKALRLQKTGHLDDLTDLIVASGLA